MLLARADEIVASLSPGKRETVREIVINSVHRGAVDPSARRFLTAASGGPELADILAAALDSSAAGAVSAEGGPRSELGPAAS